jgi:hypothetical protein
MLLIANSVFADIKRLDWLTGHWCGSNYGVQNEEVWLAPQAGSMLGMHRDIDTQLGKLKGFEFFRIVEDGAELVYWTQPGGKPAIAFRASKVDNDAVDFLNAEHDFPKRIRYRRIDANTLVARIDNGTNSGPSMEWHWSLNCKQ